MWELPDPRTFDSLLDLIEDAAVRYAGREQMALRTDDGLHLPWSAEDVKRHSKLVAWRLRRLGLKPGDRMLTWSPSTPALPAVYFGAMRAGVIVVPLDLRMAPDVLQRIAASASAKWLAVGTGMDAPDPQAGGLGHLDMRTVEWLAAEPAHENAAATDEGSLDDPFPADWEAQVDSWPRPDRDTLFEIIYTSGTTGVPKGVVLKHGTILSTLEALGKIMPPREHRTVSLLPPSHLFEQAPVLMFGTMIGAHIVWVRSRTPRVLFEAFREERVTTMVLVPQLLELFWIGLEREVKRQGKQKLFERSRRIARFLPYWARRLLFRRIHAQLGGELRLMFSAGAYLPPPLQEKWESLGIIVLQGYGATECGPVAATRENDHPTGTVGKRTEPVELRLADGTNEILVGGPTIFDGYWQDPQATAAVMTDGWYHTGDVGRFDDRGNLVLMGRTKNIIVLPNGLNVYPEDIENVLSDFGLEQAVVIETAPGRIEAVVLSPDAPPMITPNLPAPPAPQTEEEVAALRARIEPLIKAANSRLGQHQRIDDFRIWPEADFPRTHTLKIKRSDVQRWAGAEAPLPVHEIEQ
ncbi:AMP-binding protein [Piscinibacter sp.]|uniref:AMP-binding protein n=1 Tax=Piscinibacter sp. TaxID=1903157 RepID=UPI002BF6B52D|nr:AMP-binding protein [Albitalea sp.]HUG26622.1 AMP-binding protein [Albitalea sp.]